MNKVWLITTYVNNVGIQVAGIYTTLELCYINVITLLRRLVKRLSNRKVDQSYDALVSLLDKAEHSLEQKGQLVQEAIKLWNSIDPETEVAIWEESVDIDVD